jgi:hypothetical protein
MNQHGTCRSPAVDRIRRFIIVIIITMQPTGTNDGNKNVDGVLTRKSNDARTTSTPRTLDRRARNVAGPVVDSAAAAAYKQEVEEVSSKWRVISSHSDENFRLGRRHRRCRLYSFHG